MTTLDYQTSLPAHVVSTTWMLRVVMWSVLLFVTALCCWPLLWLCLRCHPWVVVTAAVAMLPLWMLLAFAVARMATMQTELYLDAFGVHWRYVYVWGGKSHFVPFQWIDTINKTMLGTGIRLRLKNGEVHFIAFPASTRASRIAELLDMFAATGAVSVSKRRI